jgi:hypothetical protein
MEIILMSVIIALAFIQSLRVIRLKRRLNKVESVIRKSANISVDI